MLRILFLDDDKPLLSSLKRSMKLIKPDWACFLYDNGRDALDFLDSESVDVVISDIRMPHMDGVEFLTNVKDHYPSPIRVILSGHMGEHESIQTMNVAHKFIAKPCQVEELVSVIELLTGYRDIFTDESLLSVINKITSLPVLPAVYAEINEALNDSNSSLDDIGKIISKDPGMATSILKAVNSPFFGISKNVNNIRQAVRMLGMETIRGLVLCEGVFRQFDSNSHSDFSLKLLWEHSLRVSNLTRCIAENEELSIQEKDYASLTGLLHDLGKLILLDQFPERYEQVLELVRNEKIATMEAEVRVFGTNHARLGAYLLGLWGCDESIVYPVAYHHKPGVAQLEDPALLSHLHVADIMDHELFRLRENAIERTFDEAFLEKVGASEKMEQWSSICQETVETE